MADNNGNSKVTRKRDLKNADPNKGKGLEGPLELLTGFLCIFLMVIPTMIFGCVTRFFKQKKSFRNKLCVLTGAGRGLGREMGLRLAREGAKVVCLDINTSNNEETASQISEAGGFSRSYTLNVANYDEVKKTADKIREDLGPVDVLINNAALVMGYPIEQWDPEEIRAMFNVNILSHYWMIDAFLPDMKARNNGHIVAISSASALATSFGISVYGVTKAAVNQLMNLVRYETKYFDRQSKVKFTTVCPFFINTCEEYSDFMSARFPIMSKNYAVDEIMKAIQYEKELVTIPRYYMAFAWIYRILPFTSLISIAELMKLTMKTPDKESRSELVYQDVVDQCK